MTVSQEIMYPMILVRFKIIFMANSKGQIQVDIFSNCEIRIDKNCAK